MQPIETELKERKGEGPFHNGHGIDFEVSEDETALAWGRCPGFAEHNDVVLEVGFSADLKTFIQNLSLTYFEDIHTITPERLLELFWEGNAEIYCCVDLVQILCLNFRRLGHQVFAVDGLNQEHEVKEQLLLPADFIAYTKKVFRR
jgi:hypothetical protein